MKPRDTRTAPPSFRVRSANEFDFDAWARMREALWPDCPLDESAREMPAMLADTARQAVFVAVDRAGELIGFAEVRLRDVAESCESSPVGYLEGWYVVPDCRGQGVGRALVDAFIAWSRAKSCTEVASDTWLDNLASRAAHTALGFEQVDTLVHFRKKI